MLSERESKKALEKEQLISRRILEKEMADIAVAISQTEKIISDIQRDQKTEQDNQESFQSKISDLKIELSAKENRMEGIAGEQKRIAEIKANYEFQKEENHRELRLIMSEIAEAEKRLSECITDLQLNQIELDEIVIEYENTVTELRKSEKLFDEVIRFQKAAEEKLMKKLQEKYRLENRIEKVDVIIENVKSRMHEEYQLSIEESRKYKSEDCDFSKEKISSLKEQILLLGNINLDAIEDYRVLSERY